MFSGIFTGSVYSDVTLKRAGMAEGSQEGVITVKTHKKFTADEHWDKVVLILRDPVDTVVAEFNRMSAGHTGMAAFNSLQGKYIYSTD